MGCPRGLELCGDPNTLGVRARSCKDIWKSSKKQRVDLKKGENPVMDWRPNSGEYRDGQQKNYSATIRAKCKGSSKVGGYILEESFNICLSQSSSAQVATAAFVMSVGRSAREEYKREEKVDVQVAFRNIKTRIKGDWYVNGKKENTDYEGQKGMKCEKNKDYTMNFQFRMPKEVQGKR